MDGEEHLYGSTSLVEIIRSKLMDLLIKCTKSTSLVEIIRSKFDSATLPSQ